MPTEKKQHKNGKKNITKGGIKAQPKRSNNQNSKLRQGKVKVDNKRKADNKKILPVAKSVSRGKNSQKNLLTNITSILSLIFSIIALIGSVFSYLMIKENNSLRESMLEADQIVKSLKKQAFPTLVIEDTYMVPEWEIGIGEAECSIFYRIVNLGLNTEIITDSNALIGYKAESVFFDSKGGFPLLKPYKAYGLFLDNNSYARLNIVKTVSQTEGGVVNPVIVPIKLKPQEALDVTATFHLSFAPTHKAKGSTYGSVDSGRSDGYYPVNISLSFSTLSRVQLSGPPIYCIGIN